MNLKKLAEMAEVSVSTVSKTFSGSREISEETRDDKCELYSYYSSYCNVDGVIIIGSNQGINNTINIPTVNIGSCFDVPNTDSIVIDYQDAVEESLIYLKKLGHRRIGFVGELLTAPKLESFKKAARKVGVPIEDKYIVVGNSRFEDAGIFAMEKYLNQNDVPTAVLTAYDNIAIGLMKAANKSGYNVPNNLSVVGFDDIGIIPYLNTPMCTINSHTDLACRKAIEIILKKIENPFFETANAL